MDNIDKPPAHDKGDIAGVVSDHVGASYADSDETGEFEFECPRCSRRVVEDYYGPCTSCRMTLRMALASDAREVEDTVYEPKMNVTPNAVALKD